MSRARTNNKKDLRRLENSGAQIVHIDSESKKTGHHTNPKLALKGFSDNGKLEKLDTQGKSGQSGYKVATVEDNFYTVYGNDDPDVFENLMWKEIETPAAPLLLDIIEQDKWPLSDDENIIFSRFLTLQFLRSPAKRTFDLGHAEFNFKKTKAYSDAKKFMSDETIRKELTVQQIFHWWNKEAPDLLYHIYEMKKILVEFEESSLCTSASPITSIFDKSKIQKNIRLKFEDVEDLKHPLVALPFGKMEDSLVSFYPLSRKLGLVLLPSNFVVNSDRIDGNEMTASIFNWLTKRFSYEVFYHPKDSEYFKKIYLGKRNQSSLFQVQRFLRKLEEKD